MSPASFRKHLAEVRQSELFHRWDAGHSDAIGRTPMPLELLLLGTLRYLGRSWTLDDLEEATTISEETHRHFLHVYLLLGSTYLYDKYVVLPESSDEIDKNSYEFFIAGLPGALGSQDATHISMQKCHNKLRQYHDSFKLPMPSRTYNMTVNHRRRIIDQLI
mmetsp:Transcript_13561/g.21152  ORF Transcript_13561/g.21152 Transcript_13561/m.21152 type:complete len:162 (-) Transcript_13561:173-658(-)